MVPKILHLLPSRALGGAEQVAILITQMLSSTYRFAYASPKGSITDIILKNNITFLPIDRLSLTAVARVFRRFQPDIIHAHDFRPSVIAAMIPYHGAIISHLHCNVAWAHHVNTRTLIYRAALRRFQRVFVVSRPVLDDFAFHNALARKATVLPNIVAAERVITRAEGRQVAPADLVYVGRLSAAKNPLRFLTIVNDVKRHRGHVTALMVGQGELEGACQQAIHDLDLGANVQMVGFHENPYPYMRAGRVLIVPSSWEGFGLVALEAQLLGVPVLCTPVGGLQAVVKQGQGGFLCATDDAFVARAIQLLEQPSLHQAQSAYAHARGHTLADPRPFCQTLDEVYQRALDTRQ